MNKCWKVRMQDMAYDKSKWKEAAKENQEKAKEMIHSLASNYTENPEMIAELLEFGSKFYTYSLNNMELIFSQNKGATFVQSYEAWKKMDTHVQRGEKGIKIFVPVKVTMLEVEDNKYVQLSYASSEQKAAYKRGDINSKTVLRFKIGTVFDIGQTDFPPEKYPEIYSVGYSSDKHAGINSALKKFCKDRGVNVFDESVSSISLKGFYAPGSSRIVMSNKLNDTQYLSTLTHEMGHMLEKHGERDISAAQAEFEADCISILLQSHFNIELTDSRKSHLADHYKDFKCEIKKANPDLTDDDLIGKVDEALTASLTVFRHNIESIQEYVDREFKTQLEMLSGDISYTYEVVECSEFPSMGLSHSDISDIAEAFEVYSSIPEYMSSMIPGINLVIENSEQIKTSVPLVQGKRMDLSNIEFYSDVKSDKRIQEEIKRFSQEAKRYGIEVVGEQIPQEIQKQNLVKCR